LYKGFGAFEITDPWIEWTKTFLLKNLRNIKKEASKTEQFTHAEMQE
jgi:hypothetical protein